MPVGEDPSAGVREVMFTGACGGLAPGLARLRFMHFWRGVGGIHILSDLSQVCELFSCPESLGEPLRQRNAPEDSAARVIDDFSAILEMKNDGTMGTLKITV
jgi:hypothetical protein